MKMARLIEADDLKAEITKYFLSCADRGKFVIDITEMQVKLYKIINSQPTAYNVEKVVEGLEEMFVFDTVHYGAVASWIVDKAKDIVRKGGV